jgi:hypothetical protein
LCKPGDHSQVAMYLWALPLANPAYAGVKLGVGWSTSAGTPSSTPPKSAPSSWGDSRT